jgi:transcription elongation GreA/GreB family factor
MISKQSVYDFCVSYLKDKIADAKNAMESAQESANAEKGMMGDKFESFREQMQIERDRHAEQYTKLLHSLELLSAIKTDLICKKVESGAIVKTKDSNYFIAVALGKHLIEGENYIVLSPSSPLGQALLGKRKGEDFDFNKVKGHIESII